MNRYLVSYDLHHQSSTTYREVGEVISGFGDTCHFQESEWVVASDHKSKEIGEAIDLVAGPNDKVFIVKFSATYRSGHGTNLDEWLERNPIPEP